GAAARGGGPHAGGGGHPGDRRAGRGPGRGPARLSPPSSPGTSQHPRRPKMSYSSYGQKPAAAAPMVPTPRRTAGPMCFAHSTAGLGMTIVSSGTLIDVLRQMRLLTPQQLSELMPLAKGRCGNARPIAKALIQRGWFTVYQVNQMLAGRGDHLRLGPYV